MEEKHGKLNDKTRGKRINQIQENIIRRILMVPQSTSPKGAKVYPASRRRSNKRVGLKGQLAPHCVP